MGCHGAERPCNKTRNNEVPGAGQYEIVVSKDGRLDTSKHAAHSHNKSGGGSMGCNSAERSCNKFPHNEVPGAGQYEISVSKDGRLDTSKHAAHSHNKSGGGSMGCNSAERSCNKFPHNEVPGAGQY